MVQAPLRDSKNRIMAAFEKLLNESQQVESKVATKEEEAEKAKNQQLLNKTIDYTVDNIINGMASLQLSFGSVINQLAGTLTTESNKLEELKKAIAVEKERLQQLNKVRLVADALHIREIAELEAEKNKNWVEREKFLLSNKTDFSKNQDKIATFEAKLKEEYNKAKGDAIKDTERKAQVQVDLLEKEWSAAQQGYELKLESLATTIERQTQQISEITTQLQEVNTQAQNLARQAFQSTAK